MSVWLVLPSKRPTEQAAPVLHAWKERGYKIALVRDDDDGKMSLPESSPADWIIYSDEVWGKYPGYCVAVNHLVSEIIRRDESAEWFVAAGDDTFPDTTKRACEIAEECNQHFYCLHYHVPIQDQSSAGRYINQTFGVMQPTGDPWRDTMGKIIDRIAGSPWLGREWCRRANGGRGPLWPEYTHCFGDEELQNVAIKYGVFWQRPDLTHHHEHWARGKHKTSADMPAFLAEANSKAHWDKYKALFLERKAACFPGSEPLP